MTDDHEDDMEIEHPSNCELDSHGELACVYRYLTEDLPAFFTHVDGDTAYVKDEDKVLPGRWPVEGDAWVDYWGEADAKLTLKEGGGVPASLPNTAIRGRKA